MHQQYPPGSDSFDTSPTIARLPHLPRVRGRRLQCGVTGAKGDRCPRPADIHLTTYLDLPDEQGHLTSEADVCLLHVYGRLADLVEATAPDAPPITLAIAVPW